MLVRVCAAGGEVRGMQYVLLPEGMCIMCVAGESRCVLVRMCVCLESCLCSTSRGN